VVVVLQEFHPVVKEPQVSIVQVFVKHQQAVAVLAEEILEDQDVPEVRVVVQLMVTVEEQAILLQFQVLKVFKVMMAEIQLVGLQEVVEVDQVLLELLLLEIHMEVVLAVLVLVFQELYMLVVEAAVVETLLLNLTEQEVQVVEALEMVLQLDHPPHQQEQELIILAVVEVV